MRPLRTDARIVLLSGAALLLGSWNLIGLLTGPAAEPLPSGPALEPELVGGQGFRSDPGPDMRPVDGQPGSEQPDARNGQGTVAAVAQTRADNVAQVGGGMEAGVPQERAAERPDGASSPLLDQVFGPDRFRREPADAAPVASRALETALADSDADGRGQAWGGAPASPGPGRGTANPEADRPVAQRRPETEKAYYEDFQALAKKDVQELERQADAVLREDGENCKKVAMLRALYDADQPRALDYFVQAIAFLPNQNRPEGVSVPTFAVGFLSQQTADPAVKGLAERIAWTGYLNVPPDLRRVAADALLATATAADLQRYASYPAFQGQTATGSGEAR